MLKDTSFLAILALGFALAFTVAQDYEGDQFTFFKFPPADLARLYGVEILELAIFDQLEDHVADIGHGDPAGRPGVGPSVR